MDNSISFPVPMLFVAADNTPKDASMNGLCYTYLSGSVDEYSVVLAPASPGAAVVGIAPESVQKPQREVPR